MGLFTNYGYNKEEGSEMSMEDLGAGTGAEGNDYRGRRRVG